MERVSEIPRKGKLIRWKEPMSLNYCVEQSLPYQPGVHCDTQEKQTFTELSHWKLGVKETLHKFTFFD